MSAPDRQWRIRFVEDLDDELVDRTAAFFDEYFPGVFGEICDPELFRWKLGPSNPAGQGILAVAVADDDAIAGVMSATMKRMTIGERSVAGSETGDTFTHPDFRRSGRAAEVAPGTTADHYLNRSVFGRLVDEVSRALADPRSDRHDSQHHHQTAFLVADHPPGSGRRDPVGRAKLIPPPNPLRTRLIRLPDSTSRTCCAPMGTFQAERLPASRNQL